MKGGRDLINTNVVKKAMKGIERTKGMENVLHAFTRSDVQ